MNDLSVMLWTSYVAAQLLIEHNDIACLILIGIEDSSYVHYLIESHPLHQFLIRSHHLEKLKMHYFDNIILFKQQIILHSIYQVVKECIVKEHNCYSQFPLGAYTTTTSFVCVCVCAHEYCCVRSESTFMTLVI